MEKILFVDDDQNVLDSMQRIFFDMDELWDMDFVDSGKKALELMSKKEFDIIISDMRMPEINGAELLKQVKQLYPKTLRFILSGYSEIDMILQSVPHANQFIKKPCNPEEVKHIIKKALDARNISGSPKLYEIISKMDSIPTLPDLYLDLQVAINTGSLDKILKVIKKDPSITAKILQLVNSAFFGAKNEINSLHTALVYLGFETLKAIVLSKKVFSNFTKDEVDTFEINNIYTHSINVCLTCSKISENLKLDTKLQDSIILGGMLHDIGKILFIKNLPKEYEEICKLSKESQEPIFVLENKILGISHAELGAYLLNSWGLPDDIVKAVCFHHAPRYSGNPYLEPMTIVFIVNSLIHQLTGENYYCFSDEINSKYLDKLNISNKVISWMDMIEKIIPKGF